jgi:hypothetical protein
VVFKSIAVENKTAPVFLPGLKEIRATDAKEVGVGNPAEETYRYPNQNPLTILVTQQLKSTSKRFLLLL